MDIYELYMIYIYIFIAFSLKPIKNKGEDNSENY